MMKTLLAAAAAFALVSAAPAYAACPNCANCPEHKVAAADKAEKKEGTAKTACGCPTNEKGECKCGAKCECGHCHPTHDHKKADDAKKTT